jgi:hypothetical protein
LQHASRRVDAKIGRLQLLLQQCEQLKVAADTREERIDRYEAIISAFVDHCRGAMPDHLERMMRKDAPGLLPLRDHMAAQQCQRNQTIQDAATITVSDNAIHRATGDVVAVGSAARGSKGKERATADGPQFEAAAITAASCGSAPYTDTMMLSFAEPARSADPFCDVAPASFDTLFDDPIQDFTAVPPSALDASSVPSGSGSSIMHQGNNHYDLFSNPDTQQDDDLETCTTDPEFEFDKILAALKADESISNGNTPEGT